MNKRNSKRGCARQLTEQQRIFLEALLTMDWLPRNVFNAVLQALAKSPREYQRQTTRHKADCLWLDIQCEEARLRCIGERPYARGNGSAAVETVARNHGMSVANAEKMLHRYKPTADWRKLAKKIIPLVLDGTIERWVEGDKKTAPPLEDVGPRGHRALIAYKLAAELAAAAHLPAPSDLQSLLWIYDEPPATLAGCITRTLFLRSNYQ
jgi:hypothetical protein